MPLYFKSCGRFIELETSKGKDVAEVNFFNAESVISHLLMDNNLCGNADNLALDRNRPFDHPAANQPLGEVMMGSWYQSAWTDMINYTKDRNLAKCNPVIINF